MKKFLITMMFLSLVFMLGCNQTANDNYIEGAEMISTSEFSNITYLDGVIKYETDAIINDLDNKRDVDYLQFFIPVDSDVNIVFDIKSYDTAEPIIIPTGYTSELQYFDESGDINSIYIKDANDSNLTSNSNINLPAGLYFIKTYCDGNCPLSEDEFYSYTISYEYDLESVSVNIPAAKLADKEAIIWTNAGLSETINGNEYLSYDINNSDYLSDLFNEFSLYQRVYFISPYDLPDRLINTYFYLNYLYYYLDDFMYQKDYIDESFYDVLVNQVDYSNIPVLADYKLTDYGVNLSQINSFMDEFSDSNSLEKLVAIINLRSIRIGSELVGSPSDYKEYISEMTVITDALFTGMTLDYFLNDFQSIISGLSSIRNSLDSDEYCYMDIMKRYISTDNNYVLGDNNIDSKGIYYFVCNNTNDGDVVIQNIIDEFETQGYGTVTVLDKYERE